MKLLMENWRGFIKETETAAIYGDLYLFEGDTVSQTSFYEAINMLSESDDDVDRFLENWERSIDHMFMGLDEAVPIETGVQKVDDAILKASTQAYLALQRLKGKAVGPVMKLVGKMRNFAEKNPKTAKAALYVGSALAAAATVAAIVHVQGDHSMDMEGIKDTVEQMVSNMKTNIGNLEDAAIKGLQDLDYQGNAPRNLPNLEPIAPEGWEREWGNWGAWMSPEELAQRAQELEKMNNTVSQAIGDPGLEQAMTGYEDTMDKWTDMFAQADANRAAADAVGELRNAVSYDEFMTMLKNGETPDFRALQDLAAQIESGEFDGEGRKALRDLIKQMPKGPERRQLRGFIRARDAGKALNVIVKSTPHGAAATIIDKLVGAGELAAADGSTTFTGATKLGRALRPLSSE